MSSRPSTTSASNSSRARATTSRGIKAASTRRDFIATSPSSRLYRQRPPVAKEPTARHLLHMASNLTPDIELTERLFIALREKTFDGVGVTRESYGPGEQAAHALVRAEAEALGLEIANDPAGNLLMTLPGADRAAKRVVLGSHLDSVAQGGNYDGAAGVLAGLAAVAGMRRASF